MYVFSGLWRKNARVFNVLLSLTKFEKPKVPCCHFTKPKKLEFAFQRCFGRSECFEITKTYKKPYFEIPNHSQIPHQTHLSPQLMRYGKLPRLNRFRFRVPLHSSYVKGDQRFAAIHQHKLPDLQRQKQQGNIRWHPKCRRFEIFSNMTLFFLYMFYSTCSFWLIAQHNQQHPFACLIQPKALPSCHLQKEKKMPPFDPPFWRPSPYFFKSYVVSVSPGNHLFWTPHLLATRTQWLPTPPEATHFERPPALVE